MRYILIINFMCVNTFSSIQIFSIHCQSPLLSPSKDDTVVSVMISWRILSAGCEWASFRFKMQLTVSYKTGLVVKI
jgi:hypothetical protein